MVFSWIKRFIISVAVMVAAFMLYNVDAIIGKWKFNRMCKEEGGPRFYAPVEKNVGWEVGGKNIDYRWPFSFDHVEFVRYKNEQGLALDVYAGGYISAGERKYDFYSANKEKNVRYRLEYSSGLLDDKRFSKSEFRVVDLLNRKIVASFTEFGYKWTSSDRVILAASTGGQCWGDKLSEDFLNKNLYGSHKGK